MKGLLLFLIVLALAAALLFAVAAYLVSNVPSWLRRLRGLSRSEHLEQLEQAGKAEREDYQTVRALTFEDLSTGCVVHLIDVGEDKLLCLCGQQYYDFEPVDDDPELNQPRKFPTSTFALLRHRQKGEVLRVFPGTAVVEPIACGLIEAPVGLRDLGIKLDDGEIIRGVPFHAVERALRAGAGAARR